MTKTQKPAPPEPPTQKKTTEENKAAAKHKEAYEENNYGGRDQSPDRDVNPAEDIHIHEGEDGEPAKTGRHNAQQRKDKKKP